MDRAPLGAWSLTLYYETDRPGGLERGSSLALGLGRPTPPPPNSSMRPAPSAAHPQLSPRPPRPPPAHLRPSNFGFRTTPPPSPAPCNCHSHSPSLRGEMGGWEGRARVRGRWGKRGWGGGEGRGGGQGSRRGEKEAPRHRFAHQNTAPIPGVSTSEHNTTDGTVEASCPLYYSCSGLLRL